MTKLKVIRLNPNVNCPKQQTEGSAGFNLQAAIDVRLTLIPGESKLIPTGLAIHIEDKSIVGCILPRSKLGAKKGLVIGNLVGIVDSDYQGQWFISAWNRNTADCIAIEPLEEIAQVVFLKLATVTFDDVDSFDYETSRFDGGISKDSDTRDTA